MIDKTSTWEDIEKGVDSIVDKINVSGKKYDWIVGINRGGLIPSVMLSHKLGVKHGVITVTHYDGQKLLDEVKKDLYVSMFGLFKYHHNVLIADDISDSGICLKETINSITRMDPDVKNMDTATIYYKPKSVVKPTYYYQQVENDVWIDFPWESVKTNELQREAVAAM